MTGEVQPRVWVGECERCLYWKWWSPAFEWGQAAILDPGSVFVPGNQPKPTIDPAEMETIRMCKEIDW